MKLSRYAKKVNKYYDLANRDSDLLTPEMIREKVDFLVMVDINDQNDAQVNFLFTPEHIYVYYTEIIDDKVRVNYAQMGWDQLDEVLKRIPMMDLKEDEDLPRNYFYKRVAPIAKKLGNFYGSNKLKSLP